MCALDDPFYRMRGLHLSSLPSPPCFKSAVLQQVYRRRRKSGDMLTYPRQLGGYNVIFLSADVLLFSLQLSISEIFVGTSSSFFFFFLSFFFLWVQSGQKKKGTTNVE
eukprot:TRINITY_DN7480_c1_g1_i1.p2 TRINITY_DN7480_c1_g1~~TRINITY_DN7480_c1_g1_i1.p2  ORF type:complete len:108 (+),score=3.30 TRINITY_DN7480_c1_g1_i1:228-551(+)